jgi:phage shock protein PspC (stress-responsive transcriptional regulator)
MSEPIKHLYRSNSNKVIFGICGGIGEYFSIDPTVIRVATIIVTVLSAGMLIFAYLLCLLIIPIKPSDE